MAVLSNITLGLGNISILSPSVWADKRSCQGDIIVINQLMTIISPCDNKDTILVLGCNYIILMYCHIAILEHAILISQTFKQHRMCNISQNTI